MTLDELTKVLVVLETALTCAAIVIGGLWAYYQHFRGRTFKPRLELSVNGTVRANADTWLIISTTQVKNGGLTNLPISQEGTALRIFAGFARTKDTGIDIEWERLRTAAILERHAWIEPGEVIGDTVAVTRKIDAPLVFKLEFRLVAKGIEWTTTTILDAQGKPNLSPPKRA